MIYNIYIYSSKYLAAEYQVPSSPFNRGRTQVGLEGPDPTFKQWSLAETNNGPASLPEKRGEIVVEICASTVFGEKTSKKKHPTNLEGPKSSWYGSEHIRKSWSELGCGKLAHYQTWCHLSVWPVDEYQESVTPQ